MRYAHRRRGSADGRGHFPGVQTRGEHGGAIDRGMCNLSSATRPFSRYGGRIERPILNCAVLWPKALVAAQAHTFGGWGVEVVQ